MASTYLQRTISSSGNQKKSTISAWFKRANNNTDGGLFSFTEDGNNYFRIKFKGDILEIDNYYGGSQTMDLKTNRLYRDCSAWYHIVFAYDSAQGTAADRAKLYINGVQETSFSTASYPSQNGNIRLGNSGSNIELGRSQGPQYFDGIISHVHYCDGYAYAASDFGETDSTTGEWKIKISPSVSYGSNGFFWLKDSIATTDHSPNSNTFTVGGGTLSKTEDCPDNVFCCLNPLEKQGTTLSNGNNTSAYGSGSWRSVACTLGMQTGKFYYEAKLVSGNSGQLGIIRADNFPSNIGASAGLETNALGNITGALSINFGDGSVQAAGGTGGTTQGFSFSAGDIAGCAVDATNNKIYWSKNGVWGNSSNPVDGTNATTIASNLTDYKPFLPAISVNNSTISTNFGNGYFETTAVSSAGSNASGIGIFEYDVPTGFTALSTKGLNL